MGRSRYKFYEDYYPYFVSSSIIQGIPLFMDAKINSIILDALTYLQNENNVLLYGYIIMPNHIHLVAKGEQLSAKFRAFKSFTARSIINYLKANNKTRTLSLLKSRKLDNHKDSEFQVWQEGLHPKQISTLKIMRQKLNYIHFNPVKSGYVSLPSHWRYSSAMDYEGQSGLIPVTLFTG